MGEESCEGEKQQPGLCLALHLPDALASSYSGARVACDLMIGHKPNGRPRTSMNGRSSTLLWVPPHHQQHIRIVLSYGTALPGGNVFVALAPVSTGLTALANETLVTALAYRRAQSRLCLTDVRANRSRGSRAMSGSGPEAWAKQALSWMPRYASSHARGLSPCITQPCIIHSVRIMHLDTLLALDRRKSTRCGVDVIERGQFRKDLDRGVLVCRRGIGPSRNAPPADGAAPHIAC